MTTAVQHPTTAPLNMLQIDPSNVRKTGRAAEPIFAASIRAKGIIEALVVRPNGNGYKIVNGGKRFAALQFLLERGEIKADHPVPIAVREEGDNDARETSLITNIARSNMHPVDEYRAFAQLLRDGKTKQEIADQYAMTLKAVDQVLALSALSDKVLDAWVAGKINADDAQAFTLAPDRKSQEALFEKMSKQERGFDAGDVRRALKIEGDIGKMLMFVGVDAYTARKGKVREDLFGANHQVSDVKLLRAMTREAMDAECERLVKEDGWAWAIIADRYGSYQYGRIEPKSPQTPDERAKLREFAETMEINGTTLEEFDAAEKAHEDLEGAIAARGFTAEMKSKSGCILSFDWQGLHLDRGRVRPEEKRKVEAQTRAAERKKKAPKKKDGEPSGALSNALANRLSVQLTAAAAAALKFQPDLAMTIGLAGLLASSSAFGDSRGPVRLQARGPGRDTDSGKEIEFADAYKRVAKMAPREQIKMFGEIVSSSLNFHCHHAERYPLNDDEDQGAKIIVNAIGAKFMESALRDQFEANAEDYFDSIAKPLVLKAITEAVNADEARKIASKPKGEIVKFATANVPGKGWLPPELRTSHYDGPKGKSAPKAKGKKKAA